MSKVNVGYLSVRFFRSFDRLNTILLGVLAFEVTNYDLPKESPPDLAAVVEENVLDARCVHLFKNMICCKKKMHT